MHSSMLGLGVLILHVFTVVLDPRLDFFAGTVAGAYTLGQYGSARLKELIPSYVCIRLV